MGGETVAGCSARTRVTPSLSDGLVGCGLVARDGGRTRWPNDWSKQNGLAQPANVDAVIPASRSLREIIARYVMTRLKAQNGCAAGLMTSIITRIG